MKSIDLCKYSDVLISISGGKDSQTILGVVMRMVKDQEYAGTVRAVHADTGAEWPQSLPHCKMLCEHYSIPLDVAVPYRALPAHIERRCKMLSESADPKPGWPNMQNRYCTSHCKTNAIDKIVRAQHPAKPTKGSKPGWPSASCRYCTSDCKRAPIEKVVRANWGAKRGSGANILSVTGERRQESPHRAKLPMIEESKRLTAGARIVTNYRPILDYTLDMVWGHIADTGLPRHVAYDRGNKRVSCAICFLATDADIRNGAIECPELTAEYLRIEKEYGFTMKNGKSLADILSEGNDE